MNKIIMTLICVGLTGSQVGFAAETVDISRTKMNELGIEVSKPQPVSSVISRGFPARITIPNAQIRVLNSMLPGLVNIMHVAEGDNITKGQILAEVSSPEFMEAQQNYLEAHSQKQLMVRNHQRNKELLDEGIISEKKFQTGQSDLQAAEAFLSRSTQSLLFSGMTEVDIKTLTRTRKMMRSMTISSPFDGVILKQTAMTGSHVDGAEPIYHVGQLNPLWVEVHVPISMRNTLKVGNKIHLEGSKLVSKIITIGRMIHQEDQGIIVRGVVEDSEASFTPGQLVRVKLEQRVAGGNFYRIPTGAVIRDGETVSLFVQTAAGFSLKNVSIIASEGTSMVVDADLGMSDQIATEGIVVLKGIIEGLGGDE